MLSVTVENFKRAAMSGLVFVAAYCNDPINPRMLCLPSYAYPGWCW